jgi:hypothetical protein
VGAPGPGAAQTYTYGPVSGDGSIEAVFQEAYTIAATAGAGGTINPTGTVVVDANQDITFLIQPDSDFCLFNIIINGNPVADPINENGDQRTFQNVTSDGSIQAFFFNCIKLNCPEYMGYPGTGNGSPPSKIQIYASKWNDAPLSGGSFTWSVSTQYLEYRTLSQPDRIEVTAKATTSGDETAWISLVYSSPNGRMLHANCNFQILDS